MSTTNIYGSDPAARAIKYQGWDWPVHAGSVIRDQASGLSAPTRDVFAIATPTANGGIGWSDPRGAQTSTAWHESSPESQAVAYPRLRQAIAEIEGSGRRDLEPLLMIEGRDAVRILPDGSPLVAGWGAVPDQAGSPDGMRRHFAATLGPFSSRSVPPHDFSGGWTWAGPPPTVAGGWRTPAVFLAVLATIGLVSLVPGVLGRTGGQANTSADLVEAALEEEIAAYEARLERGICPAPGGATEVPVPRILPPEPGLSTPGTGAAPTMESPAEGQGRPMPEGTPPPLPDPASITPPVDPAVTPVPDSVDTTPDGSVEMLQDVIDRATVLVIYQSRDGDLVRTSIGTGFFVNSTDILTNRHVIEGLGQGTPLYVGNRTLGRVVPVDVVAASTTSNIGSSDFALLRMAQPLAPKALTFTNDLARAQNVMAAGFPFVVMQTDPRFAELRDGLEHAREGADLPENVPTVGRVMARQQSASGAGIILHRASISPGNSGGPLVDECGRLAGVNTFVAPDGEDGGDRVFYALAASDAIRFLRESGVEPVLSEGRCVVGEEAAADSSDAVPGDAGQETAPPTIPADVAPPAGPSP